MKKGIMLALAVAVLVPTFIGFVGMPTRSDWARDSALAIGIWSRLAVEIDTKQGSSWSPMKGTFLYFADGIVEEEDHDVTFTFSGEFLIFTESSPPFTPESIQIRAVIWRFDGEWVFYGFAYPRPVVMLTEEPDPTGKNWESRSFTFICKGLNAPYRGDGGQKFLVYIAWRLYPASSSSEAQVRRRTLVVTVTRP